MSLIVIGLTAPFEFNFFQEGLKNWWSALDNLK